MKKLIYLFLVLSSIYNVSAMDCWGGNEQSPRARNAQAPVIVVAAHQQAAPVSMANTDNHRANEEQSHWNLLALVPSPAAVFHGAVGLLRDSMEQLDDAVGAGALERQQEAAQNAEHIEVLLNELKTRTLPQAIEEAAKKTNPKKFLSLLIAMKAQGMQPCNESKQLIRRKLNVLQLVRRQETRELLERRMKEEREIHTFRDEYKDAGEVLSDDESYTKLDKFADRLVNDEE